ncbi:MAG: prolipoprotein diacylglyceryl transferase [Oscillospiraceae bacterium]|jgi:phosphatidylglycerol:prolipoprotein diacylglycerol transferase|nr:prolipoprotein diacylglyceryl transferase [Oscillospiraceae bacterium]
MLKPVIEFDYRGLPVYNIMAALGLLAALTVLLRREKALKIQADIEEKINTAAIAGCILALVCANAANWFLFYPESFRRPLPERITSSGISFYYGMFGFLASFALILRLLKLDYKLWINEAIPPLLIFHALGRVGCSLAGCCYGRELTPPVNILGISLRMFPAREIESICLFVMFFIFRFKLKRHRLPFYLLCYSVIRFALEFGRGDSRGVFLIRALSPAQTTSILVWVALGVWLALCAARSTRVKREVR